MGVRGDGGIGDATLDAPEGRRSPTEGSSPMPKVQNRRRKPEAQRKARQNSMGGRPPKQDGKTEGSSSQAKGPRPKEETGGTALDMEAPKSGPFVVTRYGDPVGRTPLSYQTLRSYRTLRHLC
jgi:hypothetical protein